MNAPSPVQSYLGRLAAPGGISAAELEVLRRRAWIEQGVLVVKVAEIGDEWLRQALTNLGVLWHGRRMKR